MLCEGLNDMTRCLIIEGDKTDSARLEDMLSAYGFDLDAVENAADGLEVCRLAMPDVIVVSERASGTDAVSFIKRVRRSRKGANPVVLMCSDRADPATIGRAIWEGASECMVKPFDAEILHSKLRLLGII